MHAALKYMKLDFTMMRGYMKFYLMFPLIFIIFSFVNSPAFSLNYLFFFVIIFSTAPFSLEGAEKTNRLYYMLPAKRESMVLGRYLFLIATALAVWAIDGIAIAVYFPMGRITPVEIGSLITSGIVGMLLCFIQYPVYYKLGYEKGRVSSMLIYMVPAFLVFLLPSVLTDVLQQSPFNSMILFISNNATLLAALCILLIAFSAYASYGLSCSICRKKEI